MVNLSNALRLSGALCDAESVARQSLLIARTLEYLLEAVSLHHLGLTLAARGKVQECESALNRSLRMANVLSHNKGQGLVNSGFADLAVWRFQFEAARVRANHAFERAHIESNEDDFIRAARVQGAAALGLHDYIVADQRLHHALTRARQVNLVEEELPALIALAELRRQQRKAEEGREFLDDVWESAERGPYALLHADAYNVLAQIERDAGNRDKAIAAATQAYRLAWCDGPPFAYHWGLVAARKHLQELGAPEPEMPPFDESKFEPMPEVEIDPEDEFHAGRNGGKD